MSGNFIRGPDKKKPVVSRTMDHGGLGGFLPMISQCFFVIIVYGVMSVIIVSCYPSISFRVACRQNSAHVSPMDTGKLASKRTKHGGQMYCQEHSICDKYIITMDLGIQFVDGWYLLIQKVTVVKGVLNKRVV